LLYGITLGIVFGIIGTVISIFLKKNKFEDKVMDFMFETITLGIAIICIVKIVVLGISPVWIIIIPILIVFFIRQIGHYYSIFKPQTEK